MMLKHIQRAFFFFLLVGAALADTNICPPYYWVGLNTPGWTPQDPGGLKSGITYKLQYNAWEPGWYGCLYLPMDGSLYTQLNSTTAGLMPDISVAGNNWGGWKNTPPPSGACSTDTNSMGCLCPVDQSCPTKIGSSDTKAVGDHMKHKGVKVN